MNQVVFSSSLDIATTCPTPIADSKSGLDGKIHALISQALPPPSRLHTQNEEMVRRLFKAGRFGSDKGTEQAVEILIKNPFFQKMEIPENASIDILGALVEAILENNMECPLIGCSHETVKLLSLYCHPFLTLSEDKQRQIVEFLRRVDKFELTVILSILRILPSLTDEQNHALKTQTWTEDLFESPYVPILALRAFIEGHLDIDQICEILLFDECTCQSKGYITTPLSDQAKALEILSSSLSAFTKKEIALFLQSPEVQKRQIYSLPVDTDPNKATIFDRITEVEYYFLTYARGNRDYQVILSPYLLQKLMDIRYGIQASRINPVLGPSKAIKNFMDPLKRDCLIPCRLFPTSQPKQADGFDASPIQFYHHDAAYHYPIMSAIPLLHRNAFIDIYKNVEQYASNQTEKEAYLRFLDQEFADYQEALPQKSFEQAITRHFNNYPEVRPHLVRFFEENQDRFESEYKIDLGFVKHLF